MHASGGGGFPGGTVVKNPPASAGDTSLVPDPGISHMPRDNEACAPRLLSPGSGARALQREKLVCCNEGVVPTQHSCREACTALETQHSQK